MEHSKNLTLSVHNVCMCGCVPLCELLHHCAYVKVYDSQMEKGEEVIDMGRTRMLQTGPDFCGDRGTLLEVGCPQLILKHLSILQ